MKNHKPNNFILIIFIFFFTLIWLWPQILFADPFKVTLINSGDTVQAVDHGVKIMIQLIGVHAEPGQSNSQDAANYLSGLVLNKIIDVKEYGSDPGNRVIGVIYLNGKNINLEMIKAGFVKAEKGKLPQGFDIQPYLEAEEEAKSAGRGMWSHRRQYVDPKEWRVLP